MYIVYVHIKDEYLKLILHLYKRAIFCKVFFLEVLI